MSATDQCRTLNPFETRFTRPDAMSFVFPAGVDPQALYQTFKSNRFLGCILGPHGSGKTTATYALEEFSSNDFDIVRRLVLRKQSGKLQIKSEFQRVDRATGRTLLIVDGIEVVSRLHRRLLVASCRNRFGLLLTAHRPIAGVPLLLQLSPSFELAKRLVDRLVSNQEGLTPPGENEIRVAFELSNGNIREMLMRLYDKAEKIVVN